MDVPAQVTAEDGVRRAERRALVWDGSLAAAAATALCVVAFLAFAGLDAGARAAGASERAIGQVERTVSEVRRRADGTLVWSPLVRGAPVYDADAVFVGPDSEAVVALGDGSRLEIEANSLVLVRLPPRQTKAAPVAVDVVRGGASGTAGGAGLAVRTGAAATAVDDGSQVRVVVRDDGSAQIDVASGRAVVRTATGTVAVAGAERQLIGARGEASGPAQRLALALRAPASGARVFATGPRAEVRFRWAPHDGTGPYRFELARDPALRRVVASAAPTAPEHGVRDLAPGVYYWRVRRPTAGGEVVSEDRKLLVIDDRAPVALAPAAGVEVVQPPNAAVTFAWSRVGSVTRYALEVARDDKLAAPLARVEVAGQFHVYRAPLPEGRVCYRVRSHDGERPDSPWSAPACFGVLRKPRLDAPVVLEPTIERGGREARR